MSQSTGESTAFVLHPEYTNKCHSSVMSVVLLVAGDFVVVDVIVFVVAVVVVAVAGVIVTVCAGMVVAVSSYRL